MLAVIFGFLFVFFLSCSEHEYNNPYDPGSPNYDSSLTSSSSAMDVSSSSNVAVSSSSSIEDVSGSSSSDDVSGSSSSDDVSGSSSSEDVGSSSSEVSSSSGVSSSSVGVSSSSSAGQSSSSSVSNMCGDKTINMDNAFCFEGKDFSKCNGMEYNPSTQICQGNGYFDAKCSNTPYNPLIQDCCNSNVIYSKSTQKCENNIVETKCGNEWYKETTHFCQIPGVVKDLCGTATYTESQFCYEGIVGNFCGINPQKFYDPNLYECKAGKNGIYLKEKVKDADGNKYKAVLIGEQVWMAENLKYAASGSKCYGEGGTVRTGIVDGEQIYQALSETEIQANCTKYGRLYDWNTAMSLGYNGCNSFTTSFCISMSLNAKHQGVCPSGWHIPDDEEWGTLREYVSNTTEKLIAASEWQGATATDDFGFSALPGGIAEDGRFDGVGWAGLWRSATAAQEDDPESMPGYQTKAKAYVLLMAGVGMGINSDLIYDTIYDVTKTGLVSIRCLKN